MEKWDVYDVNFKKIDGLTWNRGEYLGKNQYHLVCDVIVKHADGTFLLMRRAPGKHLAGCWEASAGGSALVGETPLECAKRELREETGIVAEEMTELARLTEHSCHMICVSFYCEVDIPKDSIVLQDGETVDYKWATKEEILSMPRNNLATRRIFNYLKEFDIDQENLSR